MPSTRFGITTYTTAEAAKMIGRSKRALLEHIYQERIADVRKNDKGVREWVEKDIDRFNRYFQALGQKLRGSRRRR